MQHAQRIRLWIIAINIATSMVPTSATECSSNQTVRAELRVIGQTDSYVLFSHEYLLCFIFSRTQSNETFFDPFLTNRTWEPGYVEVSNSQHRVIGQAMLARSTDEFKYRDWVHVPIDAAAGRYHRWNGKILRFDGVTTSLASGDICFLRLVARERLLEPPTSPDGNQTDRQKRRWIHHRMNEPIARSNSCRIVWGKNTIFDHTTDAIPDSSSRDRIAIKLDLYQRSTKPGTEASIRVRFENWSASAIDFYNPFLVDGTPLPISFLVAKPGSSIRADITPVDPRE